jgi:hypothetical protein
MLLDVAYVVRDILAEIAASDFDIAGLLLHASNGRSPASSIQSANSIAFLKELQLYSIPESGYPGDAACGLSRYDVRPFDDTYLVDWGTDLNPDRCQQEAERTAEYLFRCTASPSRQFFCEHRRRSPFPSAEQPALLRTFGLRQRTNEHDKDLAADAATVAWLLMQRWRGIAPDDPSRQADAWASSLLKKLQLDANQIVSFATSFLKPEAGKVIEGYCSSMIQKPQQEGGGASLSRSELFRRIDERFATLSQTQPPSDALGEALRTTGAGMTQMAERTSKDLWRHTVQLLDHPAHHLHLTIAGLQAVARQLEVSLGTLTQVNAAMQAEAKQVHLDSSANGSEDASRAATDATPTAADLLTACRKYCMLRFCRAVYGMTSSYVKRLQQLSTNWSQQLTTLRTRLRELESDFSATTDSVDRASVMPAAASARLAKTLDERLHAGGKIRLSSLLSSGYSRESIGKSLRKSAERLVAEHRAKSHVPTAGKGAGPSSDPSASGPKPQLSDVGGHHRVLAVLSATADATGMRAELVREFGDCVSLQDSDEEGILLCCETEGIDIDTIIDRLHGRDDRVLSTARRLHTRVDVQWP